jgi:hypothetical protein
VPDLKDELENAVVNIQAIVNILSSKGIIISEQEWEIARRQASLQLKGQNGQVPTPGVPTGMPR